MHENNDRAEQPLLDDRDAEEEGIEGSQILDRTFVKTSIWRLRLSFFLFGTINNGQEVCKDNT